MSEEEVMELLKKMETLPNPDEVSIARAAAFCFPDALLSHACVHWSSARSPAAPGPVQPSLYDRINAHEEGQSVSKISRDSHNPTMKSYDRVRAAFGAFHPFMHPLVVGRMLHALMMLA
jgi:hypothetical protein